MSFILAKLYSNYVDIVGILHQYTYYFYINATNAASKDAELRWQGASGEDNLVVWKNSSAEKETVVRSSSIPQQFAILAYEKDTNASLLINGIEYLNVPLSLDKKTTFLKITDGEIIFISLVIF